LSPARPRIAYSPYTLPENQYVQRMQDALAQHGEVVAPAPFQRLVRDLLRGRWTRYDALVLNWVENEMLDPRTHRLAASRVLRVALKLAAARLFARQTVFVRHNLHPHATLPAQRSIASRIVDALEHLCSRVVVHSGAHLGAARRMYCPHPLYRTQPALPCAALPRWHAELPAAYYVVFGKVARYKRILELAQCFPADCTLLVTGPCDDAAYGQEIAGLGRPNVLYRPGFLDDGQAQAIVRRSCGLVLAHAGDSTVVSGSFFYAMSLPVPVLALETPFLRWVAPAVGSELLTLCDDLGALGRAARQLQRPRDMAPLRARVALAFGDAALARALQPVLGPARAFNRCGR